MMNRRMRTSSSFNLGAAGTNYPNHMIQRAGSNASLSSKFLSTDINRLTGSINDNHHYFKYLLNIFINIIERLNIIINIYT